MQEYLQNEVSIILWRAITVAIIIALILSLICLRFHQTIEGT